MCERWNDAEPCRDYACHHNLFWKGLRLSRSKIQETDKALAINNCCCLIRQPWSLEDIQKAWGVSKEELMGFEKIGRGKLQRNRAPSKQPSV